MAHKLSMIAAALAALVCAQQASAELYISPVLRSAVQPVVSAPVPVKQLPRIAPVAVAPTPVAPTPVAPAPVAPVAATVIPATIKAPVTSLEAGSLYGKSVPLSVALENLVPDRSSWTVIYEPGTEVRQVSWKGARDWRDAIKQIGNNHNMTIGMNEQAKRIAVSFSPTMANQLIQPGTNVWQLKSGISLRENLIAWGKQAGWQVDWSSTMVDYPIDHPATMVGQFSGKGGVVDRLLNATSNRETPLIGHFYSGNHVVVIGEAGYKAEKADRVEVDESL